ncbi:hypothetical protein BJY00DRAFT_285469 [Aspergillus carlsbadensis]|nr:hypothetical protein BJY00DRAFT_285469 [Aspergillus carlsbadensis]
MSPCELKNDGVRTTESKHHAGEDDGREIFSGDLGTALAYLRLAQQLPSLKPENNTGREPSDFQSLAHSRIPVEPSPHNLAIGGLSPLALAKFGDSLHYPFRFLLSLLTPFPFECLLFKEDVGWFK